jgi:RimJ/RimL family protein N-acetyltransferase
MRPVTLRGDGLVLSAPDEHDIATIDRLCQDPDVQRWTTVPSPYARTDAEKFVRDIVPAGWEAGTQRTWGIRKAADSALIGMIGLERIDQGAAEVGYWMGAEERGRGLMSASVRLVCRHGFETGLERIQWRAIVGNRASAAVARGCGFRYEGLARRGGIQRDRRIDEWTASLLLSDDPSDIAEWPQETMTP